MYSFSFDALAVDVLLLHWICAK